MVSGVVLMRKVYAGAFWGVDNTLCLGGAVGHVYTFEHPLNLDKCIYIRYTLCILLNENCVKRKKQNENKHWTLLMICILRYLGDVYRDL